jgi:hypothetical protein
MLFSIFLHLKCGERVSSKVTVADLPQKIANRATTLAVME